MVKRTRETVFSWIGITLFGLMCIGGLLLYAGVDNGNGTRELVQDFIMEEQITEVTVDQTITFLENLFLYFALLSLLCTAVGIVSITLIRKKGPDTAAGKVLIITAILGSVLTAFIGFFASVAYLIAGITATSKNKKIVG